MLVEIWHKLIFSQTFFSIKFDFKSKQIFSQNFTEIVKKYSTHQNSLNKFQISHHICWKGNSISSMQTFDTYMKTSKFQNHFDYITKWAIYHFYCILFSLHKNNNIVSIHNDCWINYKVFWILFWSRWNTSFPNEHRRINTCILYNKTLVFYVYCI